MKRCTCHVDRFNIQQIKWYLKALAFMVDRYEYYQNQQ